MEELLAFALPKFKLLSLLFKKPLLVLTGVPAIVAVSQVVSYEDVWFIFCWFFLGDLLSGLLASYYESKKSDHKERWFFLAKAKGSPETPYQFSIKFFLRDNLSELIFSILGIILLMRFSVEYVGEEVTMIYSIGLGLIGPKVIDMIMEYQSGAR